MSTVKHLHTYADGFGSWHAVVHLPYGQGANAPEEGFAYSMAVAAISHELRAREDLDPDYVFTAELVEYRTDGQTVNGTPTHVIYVYKES